MKTNSIEVGGAKPSVKNTLNDTDWKKFPGQTLIHNTNVVASVMYYVCEDAATAAVNLQ